VVGGVEVMLQQNKRFLGGVKSLTFGTMHVRPKSTYTSVVSTVHVMGTPSRGYTLNCSILLANPIKRLMIAASTPYAKRNQCSRFRPICSSWTSHAQPYAGELPGVAIGSSEALFIDRYAVQKIPTVDTNGIWNWIGMTRKFST